MIKWCHLLVPQTLNKGDELLGPLYINNIWKGGGGENEILPPVPFWSIHPNFNSLHKY